MYLIGHHILSPLGNGTEANWHAVLNGQTAMRLWTDRFEPVEPFYASLFEQYPTVYDTKNTPYSPFAALCITSAQAAITAAQIDPGTADTVFILSTTKGDQLDLLTPARLLAAHFHNPNMPIVVSNACTSGVSAQVAAWRLLHTGRYRHAVVVGCDVQSRFIVSGFQSFKALSATPCRPFDKDRCGLNAGEAVATMVFSTKPPQIPMDTWVMTTGSLHNDANHISGPSRTGEGCLRCLEDVKEKEASLVCVHGTATVYNDEMEAIALHRAGLDETPILALKGYYGHTMGAAGVLETILAMKSANEGIVPACWGYENCGTTYPLQIANTALSIGRKGDFIKILSGFGGCNAAVRFSNRLISVPSVRQEESTIVAEITIQRDEDLVGLYRKYGGHYPKFFKMDTLARLGFVGTEMLLQQCADKGIMPLNPALVFGNRSASIANDTDYQATISTPDNYYPSPALFVYTLPNIVTGEIAIRHKWYGETCFYVLENEKQLEDIARATLDTTRHDSAIIGWVECTSKENYFAHIQLLWKN